MKFIAEVVEVKAKKTASLDIAYTIKLVTDDSNVLALGTLDGDETVVVEITREAQQQ